MQFYKFYVILRCESVSPLPTLFEVTGYEMSPCDKTQTTPFKYLTQNVVLGTGKMIGF